MEKRLRFIRLASFVLIVGISGVKTEYIPGLEGRRAPCPMEGESVKVDHIDKSNCFSCICKNGYVECKNDFYCPPREGCHMLEDKAKNQCCSKCKGCMYNGKHHSSHTEWTDPENPCKVLRCEAGVITVSDLQCYTPCSDPLPPEPGKCCSTCPECKINGQEATDDRDVISDDPCLKCRCNKGKMTCSKKACPVLQCTYKSQYYPPGECCPVCRGTRAVINISKHCRLQDELMREGQKFSIDKCTNCTCREETSICQRSACPVLDCAPDLQKTIPGSCCKECILPEEVRAQCSHAGKYYEDGQSWELDACRSCKCQRGMPSCAMTRCNVTLPCAPGTKLVHVPGECCEKCIEVEGVCMVFGDPHYKTFDGKIYTFQGIGKYMLISECKSQSFQIRVANDYPNKTSRSFILTKRVAVRIGDLRLNLQQKGRIKLDRKKITPPYKDAKIRIENKNGNIEVMFQNGIKIFWNGKSFLEVSVPAYYKNKLCGLCGNFNGNVQDDLKTKKGHQVRDNDILSFGGSWCVGSKSSCAASNRNNRQIARSLYCGHRQEKSQKNRCKYLSNPEMFGECDLQLNYLKYYKTCKMDMCKCPNGKCYCDSLLAYARECEKLGVAIPNDWKMKSFCDADVIKRPKMVKKPSFIHVDLQKYIKQKHFNRTRTPPILIQ